MPGAINEPCTIFFAHICACVFTDEYIDTQCVANWASLPLQEDEIHNLGPVMHSCCLAGHQGILTKLNGDHSWSETCQREKTTGETAEGEAGQVRSSSKLKRKLLCCVYCQWGGWTNQSLKHLMDVINIRDAVGLFSRSPMETIRLLLGPIRLRRRQHAVPRPSFPARRVDGMKGTAIKILLLHWILGRCAENSSDWSVLMLSGVIPWAPWHKVPPYAAAVRAMGPGPGQRAFFHTLYSEVPRQACPVIWSGGGINPTGIVELFQFVFHVQLKSSAPETTIWRITWKRKITSF